MEGKALIKFLEESNYSNITNLEQGESESINYYAIKEYFKKNGIEYQEIMSVSGSILSKLITLIYLIDYWSDLSSLTLLCAGYQVLEEIDCQGVDVWQISLAIHH